MTTQYIEEAAEALCERVAFIEQRRIFDEGTPRELVVRHRAEPLEQACVEALRA